MVDRLSGKFFLSFYLDLCSSVNLITVEQREREDEARVNPLDVYFTPDFGKYVALPISDFRRKKIAF